MAKWHLVVNEESQILGVYGEALLAEAQEKARSIGREYGAPTWVVQQAGKRPHIGEHVRPRFKTGDRVGFKGSSRTAWVLATRPGSMLVADSVTGAEEWISDRSSYTKKLSRRR